MTLQQYAALVEKKLNELLPQAQEHTPGNGDMPWLLQNAMRYSLMAGGKRLRPAMLLACADMLGADRGECLPYACALEMIHTYSLIHDDLPGMDNDTLRRGRPTNHVVFGEGQAILAGDGLLSLAMQVMLDGAKAYPHNADRHVLAMGEIMTGAGVTGMVAGQCMDLYSEREHVQNEQMLRYIHLNKTAAMLTSPLRCATVLAGYSADSAEMTALTDFGRSFGLLFQATDDILDVVSDPTLLGKSTGKDAANGKLTYVTLFGLDEARRRANELEEQALTSLASFGDKADFFVQLTREMSARRG